MADAGTAAPVAPVPATPVAPSGGSPAPATGGVTPTPKPTTPKPAAAPEAPAKVKLRDPRTGQFVEVDEGEAWALYTRGKSTQKTLSTWEREKAAKDKEWKDRDARMERLKDKGELRKFIHELGHDPRQLGEEYVLEQIEEEKLSPAEKAYKEEKAKREALEAKEAERTQQEDEKRYDAVRAQEADRLGNLFADALEAAGIPEKASRMFFPAMAGLYRGARSAAIQQAREHTQQTGEAVDYHSFMPAPGFFAEHLKDTVSGMLRQYAEAHPGEMQDLFKGYAAARPVEELEGLIGEREHNGKKMPYAKIVNERYVAQLLEKRKGTPGAAPAHATNGGGGTSSYDLPGEVVRSMPGELQNLYWKMQTAHPDERPGVIRNFESTARKFGVALPGGK
jgi:hypothetical protein